MEGQGTLAEMAFSEVGKIEPISVPPGLCLSWEWAFDRVEAGGVRRESVRDRDRARPNGRLLATR